MIKKICKCCGKEFESRTPQALYCKGPHYLPCPVCGKPVLKPDNDFTRPPKCCSSECAHILRRSKFPERECVLCGKKFRPRTGVQIVCDDIHHDRCEICGKEFIRTLDNLRNGVTTCSHDCTEEKLRRKSLEKYGTEYPMQSKEVQKNFHDAMIAKYGVPHALQIPSKVDQQQKSAYKTNMSRNGVPYACMLPQCMEAQGRIISSINVRFSEELNNKGIEHGLEKKLGRYSFDICIESQKTLIELDPTYTHSSVENHWGCARDLNYHIGKTKVAEENGYRCIHVFDWDDWDKIINLLTPKTRIHARKCEIYKLRPDVGDEFLRKYHLQGTCRGQLLYMGLVYEDELYQVMTFGKSRYDKKHYNELLRLCTKPGYTVTGGASKLFKYVTNYFELSSIISYCDRAKFSGKVYEQIGMKKIRETAPQEIWSMTKKKITANLLRQRGYDQLFGTNYGKGSSNESLMLENGWLPVFDCGQLVYEF